MTSLLLVKCEIVIYVYVWFCNQCVLFQNLTNLDRSRFVRQDRSNPVQKNTQIFLVVVRVVSHLRTVRRAPQATPSFTSKHHRHHEYSWWCLW